MLRSLQSWPLAPTPELTTQQLAFPLGYLSCFTCPKQNSWVSPSSSAPPSTFYWVCACNYFLGRSTKTPKSSLILLFCLSPRCSPSVNPVDLGFQNILKSVHFFHLLSSLTLLQSVIGRPAAAVSTRRLLEMQKSWSLLQSQKLWGLGPPEDSWYPLKFK